jgi:hypothetical protein
MRKTEEVPADGRPPSISATTAKEWRPPQGVIRALAALLLDIERQEREEQPAAAEATEKIQNLGMGVTTTCQV